MIIGGILIIAGMIALMVGTVTFSNALPIDFLMPMPLGNLSTDAFVQIIIGLFLALAGVISIVGGIIVFVIRDYFEGMMQFWINSFDNLERYNEEEIQE